MFIKFFYIYYDLADDLSLFVFDLLESLFDVFPFVGVTSVATTLPLLLSSTFLIFS